MPTLEEAPRLKPSPRSNDTPEVHISYTSDYGEVERRLPSNDHCDCPATNSPATPVENCNRMGPRNYSRPVCSQRPRDPGTVKTLPLCPRRKEPTTDQGYSSTSVSSTPSSPLTPTLTESSVLSPLTGGEVLTPSSTADKGAYTSPTVTDAFSSHSLGSTSGRKHFCTRRPATTAFKRWDGNLSSTDIFLMKAPVAEGFGSAENSIFAIEPGSMQTYYAKGRKEQAWSEEMASLARSGDFAETCGIGGVSMRPVRSNPIPTRGNTEKELEHSVRRSGNEPTPRLWGWRLGGSLDLPEPARASVHYGRSSVVGPSSFSYSASDDLVPLLDDPFDVQSSKSLDYIIGLYRDQRTSKFELCNSDTQVAENDGKSLRKPLRAPFVSVGTGGTSAAGNVGSLWDREDNYHPTISRYRKFSYPANFIESKSPASRSLVTLHSRNGTASTYVDPFNWSTEPPPYSGQPRQSTWSKEGWSLMRTFGAGRKSTSALPTIPKEINDDPSSHPAQNDNLLHELLCYSLSFSSSSENHITRKEGSGLTRITPKLRSGVKKLTRRLPLLKKRPSRCNWEILTPTSNKTTFEVTQVPRKSSWSSVTSNPLTDASGTIAVDERSVLKYPPPKDATQDESLSFSHLFQNDDEAESEYDEEMLLSPIKGCSDLTEPLRMNRVPSLSVVVEQQRLEAVENTTVRSWKPMTGCVLDSKS
ncbi:hypothetical protein FRC04_007907 [Tulasnella sp. 424]|nr:hypothetical protein FRC04_007907 [Tulasnella sp. 424]